MVRCLFMSLMALMGIAMAPISSAQAVNSDFLIIAHRGASGERPEHTLAAYERAIDQGADYIEPDLVVTKDGVLVSRHENEISGTTDVASREEFEDRRRRKTIDGQLVAGWFVEDFTLAELRTLRARERLPTLRRSNTDFDGLYQVPTFAEIVTLIRAKEKALGRRIGLYPELKHPNFLLQEEGVDMVDLLLNELKNVGLTPADPIYIQCFEVGPLQRLNQRSDFKLIQLVHSRGGPADEPAMSYAEMVTPSGLADIADYADGIGAHIPLILNPDGSPTGLVADVAATDIDGVHAWTVRKENVFLPAALRSAGGEASTGNDSALLDLLATAGVTGVFSDDPVRAVAWRDSQPVVANGK